MAGFNVEFCFITFLLFIFASSVVGTEEPRQLLIVPTRYCVADDAASEAQLRNAISFSCGQPGVDCSDIQPGRPCFEPNTLNFHASVVMNQYFRLHYSVTSFCIDGPLKNVGMIIFNDPSQGSCQFN